MCLPPCTWAATTSSTCFWPFLHGDLHSQGRQSRRYPGSDHQSIPSCITVYCTRAYPLYPLSVVVPCQPLLNTLMVTSFTRTLAGTSALQDHRMSLPATNLLFERFHQDFCRSCNMPLQVWIALQTSGLQAMTQKKLQPVPLSKLLLAL